MSKANVGGPMAFTTTGCSKRSFLSMLSHNYINNQCILCLQIRRVGCYSHAAIPAYPQNLTCTDSNCLRMYLLRFFLSTSAKPRMHHFLDMDRLSPFHGPWRGVLTHLESIHHVPAGSCTRTLWLFLRQSSAQNNGVSLLQCQCTAFPATLVCLCTRQSAPLSPEYIKP